MLVFRAILSVAMVLCGIVILAEMLPSVRYGVAILPGVVLGGAMIALGAHRLSLILRARRTT
ncbi:MAG TPA: hypothetical protein VN909_05880 [Candidatus Dormibacteraeota bacterium]|nr:hypothetical protein [Candidatus Dormibacteraeota bacterium]